MAVRAVAVITGLSKQNSDADTVTVHVDVAVVGSELGDLPSAEVRNMEIPNQSPDILAATALNTLASEIKSYLLSMNVPFGVLNVDTVRILSSLL